MVFEVIRYVLVCMEWIIVQSIVVSSAKVAYGLYRECKSHEFEVVRIKIST